MHNLTLLRVGVTVVTIEGQQCVLCRSITESTWVLKFSIFLSNFNQMWILSTDFNTVIDIKFRENPYTGNRVDKFVGTRMTKVTGAFSDYARASTS